MPNKPITVEDIQKVFVERLLSTVILWNRLEARPRTDNFDRALAAEVRDALWMLTKQWQMGEFKGDDAGSPAFAKIHMATTRLNKYKADEHPVQGYEEEVPLEAKVEKRPVPFNIGNQKISLDLRLMMGRQWLKMIQTIGNFKQDFIDQYTFNIPDPDDKPDAQICAHHEVWQQFLAVAGRSMDGAAFYFKLKNDASNAYNNISIPADKQDEIDEQAEKFIRWFENLLYQAEDEEDVAWQPSALEYQFACSAPQGDSEKVMVADQYYHGHLDWYNLNIDADETTLGDIAESGSDLQDTITRSFIPVPVSFDGMPNTRWWAFEDSTTSFGDINPDTTDLGKLLLIEFGLVYANDWCIIPFTLPAGSIADVKGMAVTNVFDERFWIEAAGSGADNDWQRWNMFTLNRVGDDSTRKTDTSLLILPTTPKIQENKSFEEIRLIRDEVANMVWGIETQVPLPTGTSKSGSEAALELHKFYQRIVDQSTTGGEEVPSEIENDAVIRYQVMNTVPEQWIPFIPVHVEGSNREIQLQRAAQPRILENNPDDPEKITPRSVLLREGLDEGNPYFIHEEEVLRAGTTMHQAFQRTRWYNGKICIWMGIRKTTGRGEGQSGLAFDQIVPLEKDPTDEV